MKRESGSAIDASQYRSARIAGVTYLLAVALISVAYTRWFAPLLVWNNMVETARNLGLHQMAARIYLASALVYGLGIMVLLSALYVILKPVGHGLALLAAFCRLAYVFLWFAFALDLFGALRLVGGTQPLQAFDADHLQALAAIRVASAWDAYYIGLVLYGLGSAVCGYLWFKSRFVPRTLAVWGVVSSAFAMLCAFAYLCYPAFGNIISVNWYEMPIALFETALSFWLIIKGLKTVVIVVEDRQS